MNWRKGGGGRGGNANLWGYAPSFMLLFLFRRPRSILIMANVCTAGVSKAHATAAKACANEILSYSSAANTEFYPPLKAALEKLVEFTNAVRDPERV